MRNYTKASGVIVHPGTTNPMFTDNTEWSADDGNAIVWALNELRKAAKIDPMDFDPENIETYNWMSAAITTLINNADKHITGLSHYDSDTNELVFDKSDNTQMKVPVSAMITDILNSIPDYNKTQTTAWTGLDSLPVGSISPLLFSATGMSEKWTFANGSKIPETQPIIDWFNNDTLGFIANWNSTCSLVGAAPITLADGFLTVPDLIEWGAHLRAGEPGVLQADSFKGTSINHLIPLLK